jgi:hypothetical protein
VGCGALPILSSDRCVLCRLKNRFRLWGVPMDVALGGRGPIPKYKSADEAIAANRDRARNKYREKHGIPLAAPVLKTRPRTTS